MFNLLANSEFFFENDSGDVINIVLSGQKRLTSIRTSFKHLLFHGGSRKS